MTQFTPAEMNLLQQNGLISDNCIESQDVAEPDRQAAIKWLQKRAKLGTEDPLL
jgi:hypothetical protein